MFCVAGRCYEESCSTVALVVGGDPSLMNRLRDAIRLAGVMVTGVLSQRPVRALGDEARRPARRRCRTPSALGCRSTALGSGPRGPPRRHARRSAARPAGSTQPQGDLKTSTTEQVMNGQAPGAAHETLQLPSPPMCPPVLFVGGVSDLTGEPYPCRRWVSFVSRCSPQPIARGILCLRGSVVLLRR